jgi:hypothetical protein
VAWWWWSAVALGQNAGRVHALSTELERLIEQEQFEKAEALFQELTAVSTDELTADVWYDGAVAIWPTGDVATARKRLAAGLAVYEDPRIQEWLWDIGDRYGAVSLACDPGSKLTLHAAFVPFDPAHAVAIGFANAAIERDCSFEGMLPIGTYDLYTEKLEVGAGALLTVDLRGKPIDPKTRKQLAKQWAAEDSPKVPREPR